MENILENVRRFFFKCFNTDCSTKFQYAALSKHSSGLLVVMQVLLVSGIVYLYSLFLDFSNFHYDSGAYWQFSRSYYLNGVFSLTNFETSFRGYFFPLILSFLADFKEFWIFSSLVYTWFFLVLVPMFAEELFDVKISFFRKILFYFLFLFFWRGLFFYPLSDLPALCFFLGGVFLAWKSNRDIGFFRAALSCFFAGFFLYAAYNTRTIYVFPVVLFLVLFGAFLAYSKRFFLLFVCYLGLVLCSMPQQVINKKYHGRFTPFVITSIPGTNQGLFIKQLEWGLEIQKYETFVGDKKHYPSPSVIYFDPDGLRMKRKLGSKVDFQLRDYLFLVINYPLDFLFLIGKHFVNILDHRFPDVYITEISYNYFLSFLNFSFLYAFLGCCVKFISRFIVFSLPKELKLSLGSLIRPAPLFIFLLFLPVFLIVPGAVETRFGLPVSFMAIFYVSIFLSLKDFLLFVRNVRGFFLCASIAALVCYVAMLTNSELQFAVSDVVIK